MQVTIKVISFSWSTLFEGTIKSEEFTAVVQGATVIKTPTEEVLQVKTGQHVAITPTRGTCMADISQCTSGLTLRFPLRILEYRNGMVFSSSGGDEENSYGWTIKYFEGRMVAMVTTITKKWIVEFRKFDTGKWFNLDLSWEETRGLFVYIDNKLVAKADKFIERKLLFNDYKGTIFIGRSVGKKAVFVDMEIGKMQFFYQTREKLEELGIVEKGKSIVAAIIIILF